MVDFLVTTGGREPCLLVRPVRNEQENDSLHPPLLVPTLLPPIVDGLSSRTGNVYVTTQVTTTPLEFFLVVNLIT